MKSYKSRAFYTKFTQQVKQPSAAPQVGSSRDNAIRSHRCLPSSACCPKQDAVEAGEDGVFDLGEPSPPPSPRKVTVPSKRDSTAADSPTKTLPPGSPEIVDDWEKVEAQDEEGGGFESPGTATSVAPEKFKDAAVTLRPAVDGAEFTEETEGVEVIVDHGSGDAREGQAVAPGPSSASAADPPGAARESFIAAGLSNVLLPMGYKGRAVEGSRGGDADSDGEGEFHDAYDTAAGLAKDATKARDMKESGNQ